MQTHDHAVLEISNSGGVFPDADIETLFEPFRRLGASPRTRHSVGLGLSIVRAIARAHGGDACAQPERPGGLRVTIRLPHASSDA
jgi:signal transduction histidine kinase